jgi:biotin synthase
MIRALATAARQTSRSALSREEIREVYHSPLLDLVFRAAAVHRQHHDPRKVQLCTLLNIKSAFAIVLGLFKTDICI